MRVLATMLRLAAVVALAVGTMRAKPAGAQLDPALGDRVAASTVLIAALVVSNEGGQQHDHSVRPLGSGTMVTPDGLLLTNSHVIRDILEAVQADVEFEMNTDDSDATLEVTDRFLIYVVEARSDYPVRRFTAVVADEDIERDLAVLRINGDARGFALTRPVNRPFVDRGDSSTVGPGDPVYVFGYPEFGVEASNAIDSTTIDFTEGRVRRLVTGGGFGNLREIQVAATVSEGSSGGSVVDQNGRLIGITTEVKSGAGGSVTSVTPINAAAPLLERVGVGPPATSQEPPATPMPETPAPEPTATPTAPPTATSTPLPTRTPTPPPSATATSTPAASVEPTVGTGDGTAEADLPPVPPPVPDGETQTYENETYGFRITYDPRTWTSDSDVASEEGVYFEGEDSFVDLSIEALGQDDLFECVGNLVESYLDGEGNVKRVDEPGASGRADDRVWATYSYGEAGDDEYVNYFECRAIGDDTALVILHDATADAYPEEAAAREALLDGLEVGAAATGATDPVETPQAAESDRTPAEDDETETYENARQGFAVTYHADEWDVSPPDDADDAVYLSSGTSIITLFGGLNFGSEELSDCVEASVVAGLEENEDLSDVEPLDEPGAAGVEDERAWATYSNTFTADDGEELDLISYVECRVIGDDTTLLTIHHAPVDDYGEEVAAREALLDGVVAIGDAAAAPPGEPGAGTDSAPAAMVDGVLSAAGGDRDP